MTSVGIFDSDLVLGKKPKHDFMFYFRMQEMSKYFLSWKYDFLLTSEATVENSKKFLASERPEHRPGELRIDKNKNFHWNS